MSLCFSREDILACTAVCPIVKPDFLLNWPTQVIDFGPTVMGIASKIIVELQNITSTFVLFTNNSLIDRIPEPVY